MTKKQLIEALCEVPDDAIVINEREEKLQGVVHVTRETGTEIHHFVALCRNRPLESKTWTKRLR